MSRTDAERLREARVLIEVPERWTQGALARTENGGACSCVFAVGAVRFCLSGALTRAFWGADELSTIYRFVRNALPAKDLGSALWGFNDTHTHGEVLALLDRAIEAAERAAP